MAENPVRSAGFTIPKFPCSNVANTIEFYTQSLHFKLGGRHPDNVDISEATMCSVFAGRKAQGNIYLFKTPPGFQPSAAMIGLSTKQLDLYYDLLVAEAKVVISEEIENKPWGYRQFEIQDIDGNKLQFFKFIEGGNPGDEFDD